MELIYTAEESIDSIAERLKQKAALPPEKEAEVKAIIDDVRARGDAALVEHSVRFDGVPFQTRSVGDDEYDAAYKAVTDAYLSAVRQAADNIRRFHERQMPKSWFFTDQAGAILGQVVKPLARVGLYVPGGTATYPSTVLMTAIPARVAGVDEIVMCTPPRYATPEVLVAAREAGVSAVYKLGGVLAIAAMAYGTETVPRVDKICGPGGPYVVLAKKLVFGQVGIESLPGPSEVVVLADETARPEWVAADMLSQAEHGGIDGESLCMLVTTSNELALKVQGELEKQLSALPRREMAENSVRSTGFLVVTRDLREAAELVNLVAPEHLELVVSDPWNLLPLIRNAGAILIGEWTPEPVGDYVAGPSHVLPTGGTARFSSPLNVEDFLTRSSLIAYSRKALEAAASAAITLAEAEGFSAHAAAVKGRLKQFDA